jgi:hypothetical protein
VSTIFTAVFISSHEDNGVNSSASTPWKYVRGQEVKLLTFFTLALDVVERSASRCTSGETIEYEVGSRVGLDASEKMKILTTCRGSKHGFSRL